MIRPVAILRPEPGNAATAARAVALGLRVIRLPLFEIHGLAWLPTDPSAHDALVLTSANAVRHAGPRLHDYAHLPIFAVGKATAQAAHAAGLNVTATGSDGMTALSETLDRHGIARALHLAGRDRVAVDAPHVSDVRIVYASEAIAIAPEDVARLSGCIALLHSPRAAMRFAGAVDAGGIDRASIAIAAISDAVMATAGSGWGAVQAAPEPTDAALLAIATLFAEGPAWPIDAGRGDGDKGAHDL